MIPVYILAIEDESDREYMTWLYCQYEKLMFSTIRKYTNDSWLVDDISSAEIAHELGIKSDSVRMALTRARKEAYILIKREMEK